MRCNRETLRLYAVTDRRWTGAQTLVSQAEQALQGGATCLQLREKGLDTAEFLHSAFELKSLCQAYHVPLIINDNVEVAAACRADGVHVGQGDMPLREVRCRVGEQMLIGVSVHTLAEALWAEWGGADYLGIGAVFPTATKADARPMSPETLRSITSAVRIPTVAIGGICRENALHLAGTGVDGIAVVSALFGAPDIRQAAAELRGLVNAIIDQ